MVRNQWRSIAREALRKGPMRKRELIFHLANLIDPGIAMRRRKPPIRKKNVTIEQEVRLGQYKIAGVTILKAIYDGALLLRGEMVSLRKEGSQNRGYSVCVRAGCHGTIR